MGTLGKDLQYAMRQLRRSPGFALTAVLTLTLGVGATTAIFTLIYQVMLRPLPVAQPEQLYKLGKRYDCCYNGGGLFGDWSLFSWDQYTQIRDRVSGFRSIAAVQAGTQPVGLRPQGSAEAAEPARLHEMVVVRCIHGTILNRSRRRQGSDLRGPTDRGAISLDHFEPNALPALRRTTSPS